MADENEMGRSDTYLGLKKQPSENGITTEGRKDMENLECTSNQLVKSTVSFRDKSEEGASSENITVFKCDDETVKKDMFPRSESDLLHSTENPEGCSFDEELAVTIGGNGDGALEGELPGVSSDTGQSESEHTGTGAVTKNIDKESEIETLNASSCQPTGKETNLTPIMEVVDLRPNTVTSFVEGRRDGADLSVEVDVGDEPQNFECAEVSESLAVLEPVDDDDICTEQRGKDNSLTLESGECSVNVSKTVGEGGIGATETLGKDHVGSERAEEITTAASNSISRWAETVENDRPLLSDCDGGDRNSVTSDSINAVDKARDLSGTEDVLDKTETRENPHEKTDDLEVQVSKERPSLLPSKGDRVDVLECSKSGNESNRDSQQFLEAIRPPSPEATVIREKSVEMEIDEVSVMSTNDFPSETSSLDPGSNHLGSSKVGKTPGDKTLGETTEVPEQEELNRSLSKAVDSSERKKADQPIIVLERIDESSEKKSVNSAGKEGTEEITVLSESEATRKSQEEPAKLSPFDDLLAEIPIESSSGKSANSDVIKSNCVVASTSSSSGHGEIPAISLSSSRPSTPPMVAMECVVVSSEVQKRANAPSSSVCVAETITGNLPSDNDVFIVTDDGASNAVDRSRPKRNAARSADSKIKTLVLRALEPMTVEEVNEPMTQQCAQCKRTKLCRFAVGNCPLCSESCHTQFSRQAADAAAPERLCAQCRSSALPSGVLSWETMDFCKEDCLAQYQAKLGATCVNCFEVVSPTSMGRFCVRFGCEVKQFCSGKCLDEHNKGLKVCSYCQKDISNAEGFLAPVGDKGQFKEFCTQSCMGKFEVMSGASGPAVGACAVCGDMKPVAVEVLQGSKINTLCSEPCFAAFKFVNNVSEGRCDQCKKYFDKVQAEKVTVFFDDRPFNFCCKTCLNVYVLANRKIVFCGSCKVKKYNFDMIKKAGPDGTLVMCSLTCLKNFEAANNIRRGTCDQCGISCIPQFKLPVPGAPGSVSYFCSYKCAVAQKNVTPVSVPSVAAFAPLDQNASGTSVVTTVSTGTMAPEVYQHIVTKPPTPKEARNKAVLCKPYMHNKGTSCRPMPCFKGTQTDDSLNQRVLIPVPVPIYIPAPLHMYASPYPVPIPFPLPVPVPIFIPTTRNSAKGIFKEIKKIQEKIPTDPFEAELLMMAEMVAGEKKQEATDSESDGDVNDANDPPEPPEAPETFSPEAVDTSNAFGEDMLQMALKMASELDEPAVDMESVLTSNTITPSEQPTVDSKALYGSVAAVPEETAHSGMMRGRKRVMRGGRGGSQHSKRGRRSSGGGTDHALATLPNMSNIANMPNPEMVQSRPIEVEKPDANMRLKYTFGVNAWRHWVMQKNQELEKAMLSNRKIKPFKPDLLQLTADELNFSLCLFVKEVKKPNGQEYAPDTIYYLCLGIQQYLFENGRIDNIFTDTYYEKFTDCLDEVAKRFAALYNDSQYIVTRVEEEHLWESKQLGAHSPHVLLSTLMFFNTKHFNLVTVEEHMQLSFSHIMKHWKRNPNAPGVTKIPGGSRNVLLRFYPPQSALEANSRKKKVYEQQENEENPLRCPVKLYEFYLSKCPESVKTRNDVFYLLPERSCVPDSPVWYSTMALGKEPLMKMLHRVKMVKEINVALLTC